MMPAEKGNSPSAQWFEESLMTSKPKKTIKNIHKEERDPPPVVAIGASAGGLEALEALFEGTPSNLPIAFVIVTHLNPTHHSMLPELLQRRTAMRVLTVEDGMAINAGYVYVRPAEHNIIVKNGLLKLVEPGTINNTLPIDHFFQTLSEGAGRKIIAVVLSGTGMDGTQGVRAVSSAGGLIIAQDPTTARYDAMPASAIDTGLVDYTLPPGAMGETILKYISNKLNKLPSDEKNIMKELQPIFNLLYANIGHDFSLYKYNTICRRIEKHMSIHQIDNIATYTAYLQHNPQEIQSLFKDLLIGVTSFFRNPEAYESLRRALLNKLNDKSKGEDIRVWVPACATGEEAYSIAILLQECMEELHKYFNVQIFGTDIDEKAIETARFGVYPSSIAADVSEVRLKSFFKQEDNHYKVSKEIRKMIVFAPQNIIKDPPFTKLDLLSCRNLLIYLTTLLQKKLLPLFHYSLNYNGLLFLGSAENVGAFGDLFNVIDKKWKIFERKEGVSSVQGPIDFDTTTIVEKTANINSMQTLQKPKESNVASLVENILLENYAPVCIVLDEKENIVYIHGRTGKYLEPASGFADLNILHMTRPELKPKISAALRNVMLKKKQVSYNNLQIKNNDKAYYINLKVRLSAN
jgi:two-component system CheB/CheR fusion protein